MKKVSLSGFDKYCHGLANPRFVFDAQNQTYIHSSPYMSGVQSYDRIHISYAPGSIWFFTSNHTGYMLLSGVREVLIDNNAFDHSTIVQVVCSSGTEESELFTFLVE